MSTPETSSETASSPYSKQFWQLAILNFFLIFVLNSFLVLQLHLRNMGSSQTENGIIMAASVVASLLLRLWLGKWYDINGRQVWMRIGLISVLISSALFIFATDTTWLLIFRIIQGFSLAVILSVTFTMIHDIAPRSHQSAVIAAFGISGHVAGAFGPYVASEIYNFGLSYIGDHTSYTTSELHWYAFAPVICMTVLMSIVAVVIGFRIKETREPGLSGRLKQRGFFSVVMRPRNRILLTSALVFGIVLASIQFFILRYGADANIEEIKFFLLVYGLSAVFMRLFFRNLPDRHGIRFILFPSYFLFIPALILLTITQSIVLILVAAFLAGIAHAYVFPLLSVLLVRRHPNDFKSTTVTAFGTVFDLGIFLGAQLTGLYLDLLTSIFSDRVMSYHILFGSLAVMTTVTWVALYLYERRRADHGRPVEESREVATDS